MSATMRTVVYI